MLQQIKKIREETRNSSELAGLLQRIEETGMGIEQEIIDYRCDIKYVNIEETYAK